MNSCNCTEASLETQLDFIGVFTLGKPTWTRAVDLYDAIPKFFYGANYKARLTQVADTVRSAHVQLFGVKYGITLTAGQIVTGNARQTYSRWPGECEELVLRALRYKVVQRAIPIRLAQEDPDVRPQLQLTFNLTEIADLLREWGHTYSPARIDEALQLLFRSSFEIEVEDGSQVARKQHFISDYSRANIATGFGAKVCRVTLNELESDAILSGAHRLLNWRKLMRLKTPLARRIFEIIMSTFRDAEAPINEADYGPHKVFRLAMSDLIAEGVVERAKEPRKTLKRLRRSLDELAANKIILPLNYEKDQLTKTTKTQGRPKIADVIWLLRPQKDTVSDIISANAEARSFANDRVAQSLPLRTRLTHRRQQIEKLE